MSPPKTHEILADIWRLVALECLDDIHTLFNLLLVNKVMFQTMVPVLYNNLPTDIKPFRNAQRLEWLLGFSAGLYSIDHPPLTAKEGDQTWLSFTTTPLMADYYSFVQSMDEDWVMEPVSESWREVPEDETVGECLARLEKHCRDSEHWTKWVDFHAEKLKALVLTPCKGWTAILDLNHLFSIVHRFKKLNKIWISPDPYRERDGTSRWVNDVEGSKIFEEQLVRFIQAHRAQFPGLLDQGGGIEIFPSEMSEVGLHLWNSLLLNKSIGGPENQPQTITIDLLQQSNLAAQCQDIPVEAALYLNMTSSGRAESKVMSRLLQRCGQQLKSLEVTYDMDDWLAWARTAEEIERAREQKEWQATQEDFIAWEKYLNMIGPASNDTTLSFIPQHVPLFPNLTTLTLKGKSISKIPIIDALSLFRNSLQTVEIEFPSSMNFGSEYFGWSWELPKLESLKIQSINIGFESLSSTFCPNLRILSLKTSRYRNDSKSKMVGMNALKSLNLLEELTLSDQYESGSTSCLLIDKEGWTSNSWSISRAEGFYFPYLRKVTCRDRWAVLIQGRWLSVAPRLEYLCLDPSQMRQREVLDVASFYLNCESLEKNSQLESLKEPMLSQQYPCMRHIELKYWTIQNDDARLFEQMFVVPLSTTPAPATLLPRDPRTLPNVLLPKLWKVDLQFISGLNPNRIVRILMSRRPEMRRVTLNHAAKLNLVQSKFYRRWDSSVVPRQPVPKTFKEKEEESFQKLLRNSHGPHQLRLTEKKKVPEIGFEGKNVDEEAREQQFSFSGLKSKVGQCVLEYMGFQYVL